MAIPVSRAGFLIPALVSYLEEKSTPYTDSLKQGDIEWNYPSDVHSSQYNPKGKVWIQKIVGNPQTNLNKRYEIALRLLVSDTDESKLECLLLDWQDLIVNNFMFKLSVGGVSGTFTNAYGEEQDFKNLFLKIRLMESMVLPRINQSKGGTGAVISVWQWTDHEPINTYDFVF